MSSFTPINVPTKGANSSGYTDVAATVSQDTDNRIMCELKRKKQSARKKGQVDLPVTVGESKVQNLRMNHKATTPNANSFGNFKSSTKKRARSTSCDKVQQAVTKNFRVTKPEISSGKARQHSQVNAQAQPHDRNSIPAVIGPTIEFPKPIIASPAASWQAPTRHNFTDTVSLVAPLTSQDALKPKSIHGFTAYDRQKCLLNDRSDVSGNASQHIRSAIDPRTVQSLPYPSTSNLHIDQQSLTSLRTSINETTSAAGNSDVTDDFNYIDHLSDSDFLAVAAKNETSEIDKMLGPNMVDRRDEQQPLNEQCQSFLVSNSDSGFFDLDDEQYRDRNGAVVSLEPPANDCTIQITDEPESDLFRDDDVLSMGDSILSSQPVAEDQLKEHCFLSPYRRQSASPVAKTAPRYVSEQEASDAQCSNYHHSADTSFDDELAPTDLGHDEFDDDDAIFINYPDLLSVPSEVVKDQRGHPNNRGAVQDAIMAAGSGHAVQQIPVGLPPIVRPTFPTPVRDRSPIIGLTKDILLRTCFRIGEAMNEGLRALRCNQVIAIELYARVMNIAEVGNKVKRVVLCDLFHDRPPFLKGLYEMRKGAELFRFDILHFGQPSQNEKRMCRCIGKLRLVERQPEFVLNTIYEASWEDVDHVRGIVCS